MSRGGASFKVRLAAASDLDAVTALIAEANEDARHAGKMNQVARRLAVGRRMAAKRRGGVLLLAGVIGAGEVRRSTSADWRRLARLSEAEFEAAIETGDECHGRAPTPMVPGIVMVHTEFRVDKRGNLHRQVYAVDDPSSVARCGAKRG